MSEQLTIQTLIDQVKEELFSSVAGTNQEGKKTYPVFFVEQVELDVAVQFKYDAKTGLKISILQALEGSAEGGQSKQVGHSMKITLNPILTQEERRALIDQDERLKAGTAEATRLALAKGSLLAGQEE